MNILEKMAGTLHTAVVTLESALSAAQDLATKHTYACAGNPDAADGAMGLLSQITAMRDQARGVLLAASNGIDQMEDQLAAASLEVMKE